MPLNTQPLSEKFGVAITGVDLSKEPDEETLQGDCRRLRQEAGAGFPRSTYRATASSRLQPAVRPLRNVVR